MGANHGKIRHDHLFSNEAYDYLKFITLIFLPMAASFYFGFNSIIELPYPELVLGSTFILDAFLGIVLEFADSSYANSKSKYDGVIDVEYKPDGKKVFTLDLIDDNPYDIDKKDVLTFRVQRNE